MPVMKDSNVDVKALSNAYREKKKIRDDSNVVKIGKKQKLFLNLLKQITMTCSLDSTDKVSKEGYRVLPAVCKCSFWVVSF